MTAALTACVAFKLVKFSYRLLSELAVGCNSYNSRYGKAVLPAKLSCGIAVDLVIHAKPAYEYPPALWIKERLRCIEVKAHVPLGEVTENAVLKLALNREVA